MQIQAPPIDCDMPQPDGQRRDLIFVHTSNGNGNGNGDGNGSSNSDGNLQRGNSQK